MNHNFGFWANEVKTNTFKPHEADSRLHRLHLCFVTILVSQTALVQPGDPKSSFHHNMNNVEEDDDVKSEGKKDFCISKQSYPHTTDGTISNIYYMIHIIVKTNSFLVSSPDTRVVALVLYTFRFARFLVVFLFFLHKI